MDVFSLNFDIQSTDWTKEQKEAVSKLFSFGKLENLESTERELIKNLKIVIGNKTPKEVGDGPVCRLDLHCVRMD